MTEKIQTRNFANNHIFYNSPKQNKNSQAQIHDICMVMDGNLGKTTRIGEITKVGSTTIEIRFVHNHQNTYAKDKVSYLCRPPTPIKLPDAQIQTEQSREQD